MNIVASICSKIVYESFTFESRVKKVKAPTQGSKSTTVIPRCILEWFSIDKGSSFLLESTVPAERMERRNLLEHRFPNRQPSSCAFFLLSFSSPCPRVFYPLRLHCVYLRKLARPRAATFLCRQCGPVCNDYRSSSPLLGNRCPRQNTVRPVSSPLLLSKRGAAGYNNEESRDTRKKVASPEARWWFSVRTDYFLPQIRKSTLSIDSWRIQRGGTNCKMLRSEDKNT